MTPRIWRYALLGGLLYIIFLVTTLPASWVEWGVFRYSQGMLSINNATGSVWHGGGQLLLRVPPSAPAYLGDLTWTINPLWLVIGRIQIHFVAAAPQIQIQGNVGLSPGKIRITRTHAEMPAALVTIYYPPAALFAPKGQLRLDIDALNIRQGLNGDVEILWQNAGSNLSHVNPLGDYRLHLQGQGKIAAIKLDTVHGPLSLNGQGQWQWESRRLQFSGIAKPTDGNTGELEPALKLLGPDQGGGKRVWNINARL